MSWLISKKPEQDEENKKNMIVTSHLQLKVDPNNKTGTLDKEVVLRRIRQRKRVNRFRSLVGSVFPSTKSTSSGEQDHDKDDTENSIASPVQVLHQSTTKWVDNPFVDP
ncbi:hypothetical protein POM88_005567 [Heracleum sosnowskyi]|uniref:Uncharacterized protein n=1 Tax=Heracleum sosnowskyi TaxID=360622 RepID=A0AAD8N3W4_9APIA|nr:hypothetical protein POM88_005567 [Heracleum sosnowskyi]